MCTMDVVEVDGSSETGTVIRGLKSRHATEVVDQELGPLEDCLNCQLCKEPLAAPMSLACGHNYCSACIRRALSYNSICPTCREPALESHLRRNLALGQIIDSLSNIKKRLIARIMHPQGSKAAADALKLPATRVHTGPVPKPITGKFNYVMMSERDLKKVCKELGLLDKGDKKTLSQLHKEYVLRYNAECDATNPKSEADIRHKVVRELNEEMKRSESACSGSNIFSRAAAGSSSKPSEGDVFAQLIAATRSREQKRKQEAAQLKTDSDCAACEDPARARVGAGAERGGARGSSMRGAAEETANRSCKRLKMEDGSTWEPAGGAGETRGQAWHGPAPPAPWVAVYSERAGQPFFFNEQTMVGTFKPLWAEEGPGSQRGGSPARERAHVGDGSPDMGRWPGRHQHEHADDGGTGHGAQGRQAGGEAEGVGASRVGEGESGGRGAGGSVAPEEEETQADLPLADDDETLRAETPEQQHGLADSVSPILLGPARSSLGRAESAEVSPAGEREGCSRGGGDHAATPATQEGGGERRRRVSPEHEETLADCELGHWPTARRWAQGEWDAGGGEGRRADAPGQGGGHVQGGGAAKEGESWADKEIVLDSEEEEGEGVICVDDESTSL